MEIGKTMQKRTNEEKKNYAKYLSKRKNKTKKNTIKNTFEMKKKMLGRRNEPKTIEMRTKIKTKSTGLQGRRNCVETLFLLFLHI